MNGEPHKPGLYKWKRQENPRVYSRAKVLQAKCLQTEL